MNPTATVLSAAPPNADLLSVPWAGTAVPVPAQPDVSFAGTPVVGPGRASVPQRLAHPWDGARLDAPTASPVSFASLAAPCRPVLPSQRQPLAPIAE